MKYNSVENAEVFLKEQIEWALKNGYPNFSVWSNGKELQAIVDDDDFVLSMMRGELRFKGYWKAFQMVNGKQVSVLA